MGDVASSFSDLQRHADALAINERVLELRRHVLLEDHPSIELVCGAGATIASELV
jgi:hypothetical protein